MLLDTLNWRLIRPLHVYTIVYANCRVCQWVAVYDWDEQKSARNVAERGLDFRDAEQVFEGPTFSVEDTRFDYGETRLVTFGLLNGRMVVITHTPREGKRRIISMRKGNAREQKAYLQRLGAP